jgi:FG-GAP-like repeat
MNKPANYRLAIPGILTLLAAGFGGRAASRPAEVPFALHMIDPRAYETCAVGDINRDGHPDIVSGENWYEGPSWIRHRFRSIEYYRNATEDLTDLLPDVNGDGYPDVISSASHRNRIWWNENPGAKGGEWKEHLIENRHSLEFSFLVDLDNDGKAHEVLAPWGGHQIQDPRAWFELKNGAFAKHAVGPRSYGHGIGVGDINGDSRNDIVTPLGWVEVPADPRTGNGKFHDEFDLVSVGYILCGRRERRRAPRFSNYHGARLRPFWMENLGGRKWAKYVIDETRSQGHALTMVDLNGDGRPDFVTGKRYMAHNGTDPGGASRWASTGTNTALKTVRSSGSSTSSTTAAA